MIATAERTGKVLAVNFQQRLRPEIIAAKNLIDSGGLGKIQHVDIKITWPRTYKYYLEAGWRGTWAGEGGALSAALDLGARLEAPVIAMAIGPARREERRERPIGVSNELDQSERCDGSAGGVDRFGRGRR